MTVVVTLIVGLGALLMLKAGTYQALIITSGERSSDPRASFLCMTASVVFKMILLAGVLIIGFENALIILGMFFALAIGVSLVQSRI